MSSGTSKIVESIMSVAQEKADLIIQDANAEASQINAKAEKTAERLRLREIRAEELRQIRAERARLKNELGAKAKEEKERISYRNL